MGTSPLIPKNKDDLLLALGSQSDDRKVEADADTGITAKTVGDLRAMPAWPGGLRLEMPTENHPEQTVKISKAEG